MKINISKDRKTSVQMLINYYKFYFLIKKKNLQWNWGRYVFVQISKKIVVYSLSYWGFLKYLRKNVNVVWLKLHWYFKFVEIYKKLKNELSVIGSLSNKITKIWYHTLTESLNARNVHKSTEIVLAWCLKKRQKNKIVI